MIEKYIVLIKKVFFEVELKRIDYISKSLLFFKDFRISFVKKINFIKETVSYNFLLLKNITLIDNLKTGWLFAFQTIKTSVNDFCLRFLCIYPNMLIDQLLLLKKYIEDESLFYSFWIGTVIRLSATTFIHGFANFQCYFNRYNTLSFVFSRYGIRFWITGFVTFASAFVLLYALCRFAQTMPWLLVSFEESYPETFEKFIELREFLYETQGFINMAIKKTVISVIFLMASVILVRLHPEVSTRLFWSVFDPEKIKPVGVAPIKTSSAVSGGVSSATAVSDNSETPDASSAIPEVDESNIQDVNSAAGADSSEMVDVLEDINNIPYTFDDWGIVILLAIIGYFYFGWRLDAMSMPYCISFVEDPINLIIKGLRLSLPGIGLDKIVGGGVLMTLAFFCLLKGGRLILRFIRRWWKYLFS